MWRFIVWRRNKNTPSDLASPTATVVHLPQNPDSTHPVHTEKGLEQKSLPPSYSPEPMAGSPSSIEKFIPPLNLDVSCGTGAAQRSPLRSASFHPNAKTQSFSSRISARMSVDTKKLYVDYLRRRRHELTHSVPPAPD